VSDSSRPAIGVLQRLASQADALAGDLQEESLSGRSASWVWRQVIVAIVVSACRDLRHHPLLALRAVMVGYATSWVCVQLTAPLRRVLNGWVLDQLIISVGSRPFVMLWATDLHHYPVTIIAGMASGWVVGRLHREHGSMVFVFATAMGLRALVWALSVALIPWTTMPGYINLPAPLFTVLSNTFMPPMSILCGGLYGLRVRRE
jgi:hypothetical protein